jgi:hypothetical protein
MKEGKTMVQNNGGILQTFKMGLNPEILSFLLAFTKLYPILSLAPICLTVPIWNSNFEAQHHQIHSLFYSCFMIRRLFNDLSFVDNRIGMEKKLGLNIPK